MNNFSYTEKNKEELFENGCTFFKFQSQQAIETLKFWRQSITHYVNDSTAEYYKHLKCKIQSNQHWHYVEFDLLSESLISPEYLHPSHGIRPEKLAEDKRILMYQKQLYDYINEINNFFYNLNDCILPHFDGMSPGRNASLLMYFGTFSGDELTKWYPELGGELVISKPTSTGYKDWETLSNPNSPSVQYVCPPISGACALIDFTKGDPMHEVKNMNIRKFQRIVLNTFLTTDVAAKKAAHE